MGTEEGGSTIAVRAEVSKVAEIDQLSDAARQRYGRHDIVVAYAGIELVGRSATGFDEADFDRPFEVNSRGAIITMQPGARDVGNGGRIIFVGSRTTAFPMPGHALYGSSKMAPRFCPPPVAQGMQQPHRVSRGSRTTPRGAVLMARGARRPRR
ncbi:SDR family NAD(P)-dependent oxidoreductase [Aurantimonas sp. HBX-1]|uniref:SDR family NAD(P)-dependent oxidoreductase n=1 Tax=Aurantimonas sp. HBX-1 TaxID=2906072 RepID=UPI00351CE644